MLKLIIITNELKYIFLRLVMMYALTRMFSNVTITFFTKLQYIITTLQVHVTAMSCYHQSHYTMREPTWDVG